MNIQDLIQDYISAKTQQDLLRGGPNRTFVLQEYYAACDATSRAVFKMINHPDWSADLEDQYYPRRFEVPYPVSC